MFGNNVPFLVKCVPPGIDWLLFILEIHRNVSFSGDRSVSFSGDYFNIKILQMPF